MCSYNIWQHNISYMYHDIVALFIFSSRLSYKLELQLGTIYVFIFLNIKLLKLLL